jgi:predicted Na+-dependent transporter
LDRHQGIDVMLAVLVFATALTIDPAEVRGIGSSKWQLVLCLVCGISILPMASWAVSKLIAGGDLRNGVMVIGLAPCEIASIATTRMSRGNSAFAALVLVGSTLLTVSLAGLILKIETGNTEINPAGIIANLTLVVGLPFLAGAAIAWRASLSPRIRSASNSISVVAVAALVALIAGAVNPSVSYLKVLMCCVAFLLISAGIGAVLGYRQPGPALNAILLTTSMRDFAIAAGIATDAFGGSSAGPLGVYGILVLVWGTALAGWLRKRPVDHDQKL